MTETLMSLSLTPLRVTQATYLVPHLIFVSPVSPQRFGAHGEHCQATSAGVRISRSSVHAALERLLDLPGERGQRVDLVVAAPDGARLELRAELVDLRLRRRRRHLVLHLVLARQHAAVQTLLKVSPFKLIYAQMYRAVQRLRKSADKVSSNVPVPKAFDPFWTKVYHVLLYQGY